MGVGGHKASSAQAVEQMRQCSFCLHLHPGAGAVPQPSVHGPARVSWSPRSADTDLQAHRRDKLNPETARPTNTPDNQMAKGKPKYLTNRKKATWHHQDPVLTQEQVLDTPTYRKSKIWIENHISGCC